MLKETILMIFGVAVLTPGLCQQTQTEVPTLIPSYKYVQTLVESAQLQEKTYLAFPILMRLNETELLIGYKRGYAHLGDPEADFEISHFNPVSERVDPHVIDLKQKGITFENGEFVRFSNGDISCFLDAQAPGVVGAKPGAVRLGLHEYRSKDGGRSFQYVGKVGAVDGVEYGYAFEAITSGDATQMLVMTFANLPGGRPASPSIPHNAGSVDVIRTDDNGKTWHLVRNLSQAFGNIQINESSFIPYTNGYLTSTRGYENRILVQRTNDNFELQKHVDLTATYPFIRSIVGRPRIFEHDGGYYLLGRNFSTEKGPMKLCLFRLNPETLVITKQVILDNAENENVIDGYYAVPYWQERNGHQLLNVITYKRVLGRSPDIVRLEFDWNEVR